MGDKILAQYGGYFLDWSIPRVVSDPMKNKKPPMWGLSSLRWTGVCRNKTND